MRIANFRRGRWAVPLAAVVVTALALAASELALAQQPNPILKAEADRVAVIEKVKPSVLAVFAHDRKKGGGSGVIIHEDGYALTNFHVVAPCGPTMQCGTADGVLYDAVLVGLDKVGDVALIKLLPKQPGKKFAFTPLGDSDLVREGQWSLAMGNPFLLATDFTPTVSFGVISGVSRYQEPAGPFLEYTDCIQFDTSINPGNSGGPLFNMKGELIGINGAGSFDKRNRINSGVGYAISINQIKNFLGHLYGGIDVFHASLGAVLVTQTDKNGFARMTVTTILEDSDVARRGLDIDHEVLTLDGRILSSANHFKNVMGLFPADWRVPLEHRNPAAGKGKDGAQEVLARLMRGRRKDEKTMQMAPPNTASPAFKFYEPKPGFVNYRFNVQERDRLLAAFAKHGDFSKVGGEWVFEGGLRLLKSNTPAAVNIKVTKEKQEGKGAVPVVRMILEGAKAPYVLEPLTTADEVLLKQPAGSGGLLAAMFQYHKLLTEGVKGPTDFHYAGVEPIYPPAEDGSKPKSLKAARLPGDADVLAGAFGAYQCKWYFDRKDGRLRMLELRLKDNEDPCEVYFSDYRQVGDGRELPHRLQVIHGDLMYGTLNFSKITMNP